MITLTGNTVATGGGTGNYTFIHSQVTGPNPFNSQFHPYLIIGGGECDLIFQNSGAISATVTAQLTWTHSYPGDLSQPPPTVDVLETGSAGSGDELQNPTSVSTTASDGLGDAVTYPAPNYYGAQCSGKHLLHFLVSAGQTTITLPTRTLGATLSWLPVSANVNGPGMGLNYSVTFDTRDVTISSGVDVTNMKAPTYSSSGAINYDAYGNIIYSPLPHTPTVDGTMYGDIGIGYGFLGGPDGALIQSVNYTSHLTGLWGAATTYNWFSSLKQAGGSGPTFGNTYATATVEAATTLPLIIPGDTGKVDHIHLTVQDSNDGAQASANYYLALHQPVEFLPSKQATEYPTKVIEEVEVGAPGYASPGLTVNCTWNAPGAYWDYLAGSADAMAEIPGVDETLPWFGLFCASAGIALDHLKPVPDTGGATFDPVQPGSDFPDEALHPFATTPHSLFKMKPHILGLYKRTHLLQDTWSISGFVSEAPIDSDVYLRSAGSFGTYNYSP